MILFNYLKSTILSKVVMAVTGFIIVAFLLGHTMGNLQLFLGKEVFNHYAHSLQSLGKVLWIIRTVMILSVVFHIITSVRLKFLNLGAKPQKYYVKSYVKAKLSSRTMIWTGIMIAAFVVYHIMHFTIGNVGAEYFSKSHPDSLGNPDVYFMVIKGFQSYSVSLFYIVAVVLMGFHLSHAIQSMFQTLGLNHPKYNKCLRSLGPVLAVIIAGGLITLPLSVMFRLIGAQL